VQGDDASALPIVGKRAAVSRSAGGSSESSELRRPYVAEARRWKVKLPQIFQIGREPARTVDEEVGSARETEIGLVEIAGESVLSRRRVGNAGPTQHAGNVNACGAPMAAVPPMSAARVEQALQRLVVGHVIISVTDDEKSGQCVDAATEKSGDVERGVIGPLEILDDHDRGSLSEAHLAGQDVDERVPIVEDDTEDSSMMPRHIAERTERARRDEFIAPPLEHSRVCRGHFGEGTPKRRLADAGLTGGNTVFPKPRPACASTSRRRASCAVRSTISIAVSGHQCGPGYARRHCASPRRRGWTQHTRAGACRAYLCGSDECLLTSFVQMSGMYGASADTRGAARSTGARRGRSRDHGGLRLACVRMAPDDAG